MASLHSHRDHQSPATPPTKNPQQIAKYLGKNESGEHEWEILGEVYTDTVNVIGNGYPDIGAEYPAASAQPARLSHWMVYIAQPNRVVKPKIPGQVGEWTHERANPARTSTTTWTPVDLTHIQRLSGFWDGSTPMTRVYQGTIYVHVGIGADVLALTMADHHAEFYDEGTDEYIPTHYSDNTISTAQGFTVSDFILNPHDEEDGNLYFLWVNGVSKTLRAELTTAWSEVVGDGHKTMPGTLFVEPGGVVGCLTCKDHRLHMVTFDPTTGAASTPALLEQTPHPLGGFVEDEPVPLVSGGTYDSGDWTSAGASADFLTWWWESVLASIGTNGLPVNPWGFVNAAAVAPSSALLGQRRPGTTAASMGNTVCYWGDPPDPEGLLSFCKVAGVLHSGATNGNLIIPMPPAFQYLPTIPAYTSSGALEWEVLGWETSPEDDPPYHYKDYYSPRMILGDRLVVTTLRLTWQSIEEPHVEILGQGSGPVLTFHRRSNNPADPNYDPAFPGGYVAGDTATHCFVYDREYSAGDITTKRSRRLVGIETFQETFSLASGAKLSSASLVPQVESMFVSRGDHAPLFPPMHGSQWSGAGWGATSAVALPAVAPFMGYTTSTYWPAHSTWFTALADGYYWSYGMYSNTNQRVPAVFTATAGKPGLDLDILEGDVFWDPSNNQNYNRVEGPPFLGTSTFNYGNWGIRCDANNNGSPDALNNIPPPSAFRYEAVLNPTHFDLIHVLDYFNPLANSTGELIIYPPKYGLEFPASALVGESKFALSTGSNSSHSWSGGTLANRMMHIVTPTHDDWQTDTRQTWQARDESGAVVWTHYVEASEFTGPITAHRWGRPQCADGEMRIVHRINDGPLRLRIVDDETGDLISDEELTPIEPHTPEGDNGGAPYEVHLAGDVSIVTTTNDSIFDLDPFSPTFLEEIIIGHPAVHGLYVTPPEDP